MKQVLFCALAAGLLLPSAPAAGGPGPASGNPDPAGPAPAGGRQAFTETTQVTAVEIPVQVVRDGEPVRGLTAADFELYEGRKRQALTGFDVVDLAAPGSRLLSAAIPPAGRRHFLLVFDLSNSHPKYVMKARDAVTESLLKTLQPSDLVAVSTYGGNSGMKLVLGFTSDRRQLIKAIATLGYTDLSDRSQQNHLLADVDALEQQKQSMEANPPPSGSGASVASSALAQARYQMALAQVDAMLMSVTMESKLNQRMDQAEARNDVTAMTEAFGRMARMMDSVAGRKLVVLFSEGFDSTILQGQQNADAQDTMSDTSMRGGGYLTESDARYGSSSENNRLEKMLETFRRSGCVIEAVDIGGLRGAQDLDMGGEALPSGKTALFQMAHDTGGELFQNFNDLGEAMQQLARSTAVTYLLTFQPQGPLDPGSFHPIKVVLKKAPRGARVTYRSGYYAPRPFSRLAPTERRLAASDEMMSGGAAGSIAMAVLATPLRTAGARAYVPVVVEADGATLLAGGGAKTVAAELYVNAVDAQGEVLDSFDQAIRVDLAKTGPALEKGGLKFFGHLELPPGDCSVRVMVRNDDTGAYGKRSLFLTVPAAGGTAPELLPPLFPEAAGRWAVVMEPPRGEQRDAAFPFKVGDWTYLPAARPALAAGQPAAMALLAYNLGKGQLSVRADVQSKDGRDLGAGEIRLDGREPGSGIRPDVVRAVFRAPRGLAPGEYRLVVTITGPAGSQTVTSSFTITAAAAG